MASRTIRWKRELLLGTFLGSFVLGIGTVSCGKSSGSAPVKRVFVSTTGYGGDLGGLAGADAKCTAIAAAGALGGNWTAWLSDSSVNAIDRIQGTGPWYLTDGFTKAFNNRANLATIPIVPIGLNENGAPALLNDHYWTGTDVGGIAAASGHNCTSWTTSTSGTGQRGVVQNGVTTVGNVWTDSDDGNCSDTGPKLLCFEQ